ncbi:MAG: methyltransferase [Cyanobacteria bacterium P01_D01_bin.50]
MLSISDSMLLENQKEISPQTILLQASMAPMISKALATATKLNIPDKLVNGSKTAEELAEETGTYAPFLYRLLRFLTGLNVFTEDENKRFGLTSLSSVLRSDVPDSPREWVMFNAQSWRWEVWQAMMDVVVTGKNSYEHVYKKNVYQVFAENPEYALGFTKAMKSWSSSVPEAIVDAYDFSNAQTIVDLGGGMGSLLASILQANPTAKGILFDQPPVVEMAKQELSNLDIAERCSFIGGNFFENIPTGGDVYIFSCVLNDWCDDDCIKLLKKCRTAIAPGGKILIIEQLIGDVNEPTIGKFVDMMMMLETFGPIRNVDRWSKLLDTADLKIANVTHTNAVDSSLIEVIAK